MCHRRLRSITGPRPRRDTRPSGTPPPRRPITPELLKLAGELHNHKVLDALQRHFRAGDMKAFYATAEKVLQIKCGNPVVRSVINYEQLISERDQVDAAIA